MDGPVILVGIDEAGYGPVVGPLVISATAFEVPREMADRSLWAILRSSVTRSQTAKGSRLVILDSKKLHKPQEGIGRIERTALATVGAWGGIPPALKALVGMVAPQTLDHVGEYPWYRESDPALPIMADANRIRISSSLLKKNAEAQGVKLAGFWSEVLLEGHFNRLVGNTNNKAVVLLGLTLRLMQRVADAHPGKEIRFLIDKQGARDQYAPKLLAAFESRTLKVVAEGHEYSEYEMVDSQSRWQISFAMEGEDRHLPTALASVLSKYLREAFMSCVNSYWRGHIPDLAPTAGYYGDGQRFIRAITPHAARLGIAREIFVRDR
ncbi:MAG TPA: hypothetical protein VMV81_08495 [Phycisphaerae bacterium]|nr:hypothetical protein [Phycisphaerae bacterium]